MQMHNDNSNKSNEYADSSQLRHMSTTTAVYIVTCMHEGHLHPDIEIAPVVGLALGASSDRLGNSAPLDHHRDGISPRVGTVHCSDLNGVVRQEIVHL